MIEIVLDTETTGLSVKEGHRIVEIGCVELENQIPTKRFFHCLLNPERKVSEDAFKIHGFSDEFLSNKKKFSEIAKDFLEFINDKKLIIHNADFDLSHLNNELTMIGKNIIKKNRVIDTLELAREKFPGSAINLDSLCKKFRINYSKKQRHNALADCELLSKVYINLIDQKEPTLDFITQNEFEAINKKDFKFTIYSKKIIQPTSEEMQLHKIFLKKELKKNLFN
jgi:DNA polymerase-3 subunit epsilon